MSCVLRKYSFADAYSQNRLRNFFIESPHGLCYNNLKYPVFWKGVRAVVILGVDPGYATVGWGVVDYQGNRFRTLDYGAVITESGLPFERRLEQIYDDFTDIIGRLRPSVMSIEKLYFNTNTTTAIGVAEARGCILLAARKGGVAVEEYTPLQVKQSVTGYGKAVKKQVMEMTRILLGLPEMPKPDDTADALALAICQAHCGRPEVKVRSGI